MARLPKDEVFFETPSGELGVDQRSGSEEVSQAKISGDLAMERLDMPMAVCGHNFGKQCISAGKWISQIWKY